MTNKTAMVWPMTCGSPYIPDIHDLTHDLQYKQTWLTNWRTNGMTENVLGTIWLTDTCWRSFTSSKANNDDIQMHLY